mgnify:CR=1 FL=1
MRKTYSELMRLNTFEERFEYLKLNGQVGQQTFGGRRPLNQYFYKKSVRWKKTRDKVIMRDNACDLGVPGRELNNYIFIHHINPISDEDILNDADILYDPENLISTSLNTHNAIHYSDESVLLKDPVQRRKNDTCPWKK